MPMYVIERNFAEQLAVSAELMDTITVVNDEEGIRWLLSFLSADMKKSYCVFEAPNPDAILAAARRLGMPADVITQVDEFRPEMFLQAR